MALSNESGMGRNAVLFLAVSLVMFCTVQTTVVQQQNAKSKLVSPTKTPTTLSDVVKMLMNLEKRYCLPTMVKITLKNITDKAEALGRFSS